MDSLEKLKISVLAYKALPEDQYRSIGEHLLPHVTAAITDVNEWKQKVKDELEDEWWRKFQEKADSGQPYFIEGITGNTHFRFKVTISKA